MPIDSEASDEKNLSFAAVYTQHRALVFSHGFVEIFIDSAFNTQSQNMNAQT